MRRKKEKGFTLIELLAVIVILAIILIIAVPAIGNIISQTKKDSYETQRKMIVDASSKYVMEHSSEIEWSNNLAYITLSDLQEKGILDGTIKNPKGGNIDPTTRITLTKDDKGKIHYLVSMPEELSYQFTDTNAGANGTFKYKNGAHFYIGPDPNNWIEFGRDSSNNILMWRIIKIDEEGIKIIYEGVKNGSSAPTANGRITIDGSTTTPWDTAGGTYGSNKWERPADLKPKLATWYDSLQLDTSYINPVKWCLGGSGQDQGYPTSPVSISHFLSTECVDGTYGGGTFKGKTTEATGYGMIRASDYLSTTSSDLCTGSYYETDNNNRDCGVTGGVSTNFLYKSAYHYWTYSAAGPSPREVWIVHSGGFVVSIDASSPALGVRPVLNLKSDITYKSGSGTLADPYIVE